MERKEFLCLIAASVIPVITRAQQRQRQVSDGCDGCELIYEGMPKTLSNTTYLSGWNDSNSAEKLVVQGRIFNRDGITPAENVILYIYHTDRYGYYSKAPGQQHGLRHGHLRGWVKTGADGRYKFYTTKPAPYPQRSIPAHIHPVVKEPGTNEYYLDEYVFEGDALLNRHERLKMQNRGGSGITRLIKNDRGWWVCERDIVLGLNIPNYTS